MDAAQADHDALEFRTYPRTLLAARKITQLLCHNYRIVLGLGGCRRPALANGLRQRT